MAINSNVLTIGNTIERKKTFFIVSFSTVDATACELIKAAPSAGAIYITSIDISSVAAGTVKIGSGKTSTSLTAEAFEFIGSAEGINSSPKLEHPVKLTDTTAMYVDTSAAGNTSGVIQGFVA